MLNNKSVADYLTAQFNLSGQSDNLDFAIFPNAFKTVKVEIQGILVALESNSLPLISNGGFISREYVYMIHFNVIDRATGIRTQKFTNAVVNAIQSLQGKAVTLDGGSAIFTFSVPQSLGTEDSRGIGESVLENLYFKILYTAEATTTSNKIWLLDGVEVPYLEESIDLDIQGATNNIYGLNATQSLAIKQTKYYRFTLPYDNSNAICGQLQRDILSGNMNKTYALRYYDGVAYTSDAPYTTTVSLFRTGNSGAIRPSISNFDVVFTDVDDGSSGTIQYQMALIDNQFDDNSVNVRYFENRQAQQDWYTGKIALGAPYAVIKAPNLNGLTITQQVYIKPSDSLLDLNGLLTKNYAIIKAIDKATGNVLYYYYFYIQTANGGANSQILVDLKMDTVQTYYFDPNIQIPDCLIERAHLNRWVDNGDGTVKFDGGVNSALFEREPIKSFAKRTKERDRVKIQANITNPSAFNTWFDVYGISWLYVFLKKRDYTDANGKLNLFSTDSFSENTDTGFGLVHLPYYIMAIPVANKSMYVKIEDVTYRIITNPDDFLGAYANGGNDSVVQIKISRTPPFLVRNYVQYIDYDIDAEGFVLNGTKTTDSEDSIIYYWETQKFAKIIDKDKNSSMAMFLDATESGTAFQNVVSKKFLESMPSFSFSKNEIINALKEPKFNPKLLSEDFTSLALTDDLTSFDYDLQKVNSNIFQILYTEPRSPDISRFYARIQSVNQQDDSVLPNKYYNSNFFGLTSSVDMSLPYSVNMLDGYLAANKNFYMQRSIKNTTKAIGSVTNIAGKLASGDMAGAATNLIDSTLNIASSQIDSNLTLNNMESAPEQVQSANGNTFLITGINQGDIFVELKQCLPQELKIANDFMSMFGYTFNCSAQIKECDNIRQYHNYIQAQIENIQGITISNDARNDIRRRFAQGIRFWNSDNIQYDLENYEKWLV